MNLQFLSFQKTIEEATPEIPEDVDELPEEDEEAPELPEDDEGVPDLPEDVVIASPTQPDEEDVITP